MKNGLRFLFFLLCMFVIENSVFAASAFNKKALATDIDTMMINHYLKKYFPAIIDPQGGVLIGFDRQFKATSMTDKPLNMEARHLWSSSIGMIMHPEYAGFKQSADAAFAWIRDKAWDKANGGSAIHSGTNRACTAFSTTGQYGPNGTSLNCDKPVYHEGFALTGLSAYYMATKDTMALYIAKTTFKWIDQKAHDSKNGWYYGFLDANGNVLSKAKDDNFGMHYMEGLAWLYLVWPDDTLKARVKEIADLFTTSGWMRNGNDFCLYNNETYSGCSGNEWGHDAELVYLLYTCYQMIGVTPPQTAVDRLKAVHAFVRSHSTPGTHFQNQWWYDAELLASYCSMGTIFGAGDSYLNDCQTHWNFIKAHYFDPVYGGWYYNPDDISTAKGNEWECTYHAFKCMLFCRNWLLGSLKGWVNPLVTSGKQNEKFQEFKNEAELKKAHYIMIVGNGLKLKQTKGLYNLMGRSVNLDIIQSRLQKNGLAGVYVIKP
jgi:mannobiose 2-epimerase